MNTLTDRIRAAREEAGLSQTEVARALRISASAVNQWEQGFSKNIKLDHFFALAHLLGQDPLWLATGKLHPQARQTVAKSPAPNYPSMTREERVLLHYVRQLPNALRQVLLRFLKGLTKIYASPDQPVA
ncbi:MAG: helix-turn-helix transcriptional regulator [Nitrospira sp.]|nr:helix-turn-helix transcriptional regulator [Nitrospira sp.]